MKSLREMVHSQPLVSGWENIEQMPSLPPEGHGTLVGSLVPAGTVTSTGQMLINPP